MQGQNAKTRLWLTAGLSLLILALLVGFVDEQAVLAQIRQADWIPATLATVMLILGLFFYAQRWRQLLGDQPPLSTVFHAGNVGHLTNILVPMRAGEAARVVLVARGSEITIPQATSSVAVERWFEQVMRMIALLGAVALGANGAASGGTVVSGLGFLGLALAGMLFLTRKQAWVLGTVPQWLARLPRLSEARGRRILAGLLEGLVGVASPRRLVTAMLWSLLAWGSFLGFHLLTLYALPGGNPTDSQLAVALGALALAPPSAPTQPGIYHASVVAPLGLLGYNAEALTAYAVLLHGLQILGMGMLGAWGFLRLRTPAREAAAPPAR